MTEPGLRAPVLDPSSSDAEAESHPSDSASSSGQSTAEATEGPRGTEALARDRRSTMQPVDAAPRSSRARVEDSRGEEPEPERVDRLGLNAEAPLTRAERARPLFEHSHEPASSDVGPMRALDSRQMLFEPGEEIVRPANAQHDDSNDTIELYGVSGPQRVQGMTRQARSEQIYGRLRRVMELGRNPR